MGGGGVFRVSFLPPERTGQRLYGSDSPLRSHLGVNCSCTDGWLHTTNLFLCGFLVNILSASKDRSEGGRANCRARKDDFKKQCRCMRTRSGGARCSNEVTWSRDAVFPVHHACLLRELMDFFHFMPVKCEAPLSLWGSFTTSLGTITHVSFSPSFSPFNVSLLGRLANYRAEFLLLSILHQTACAIGSDQWNSKAAPWGTKAGRV